MRKMNRGNKINIPKTVDEIWEEQRNIDFYDLGGDKSGIGPSTNKQTKTRPMTRIRMMFK